jgi:nucleoporin p58/p45
LRPRFVKSAGGSSNPSGALPNQPVALAPTSDFYSGIPKRPSHFMLQTVNKFEKYLGECCKWIAELEQLVQIETSKRSTTSVESLPKVMSNVHDYFIYVASKVENLHQYVVTLKTEYLHGQRRLGNASDPFLEANRREAAKQEAAAKRVHPTLHLPAPVQPTTQISAPTTSQPQQSLLPSAATSSSAFPAFSMPASAPSTSSLFSTPTTPSLFSTPTTPSLTTNLFGTTGSAQLSTPFGTSSTPTLGSTPAPSGFGTITPSFPSTPAIAGTSLFSTPFGGGATASGSSFGGTSKGRSKARGRR